MVAIELMIIARLTRRIRCNTSNNDFNIIRVSWFHASDVGFELDPDSRKSRLKLAP